MLNVALLMNIFFAKGIVTASCYRSLNALTEVEEPAGMGESLGTGATDPFCLQG